MSDKAAPFEELALRIDGALGAVQSRQEALELVCRLLSDAVPYYNWVGFYLAGESGNELVLGPYVGEPTEHTRIPYGKGICGQAAQSLKTVLVQDVSEQANYLSCSLNVRAEIIVPIFRDGVFVGELDIDSHTLAPFSDEDRDFLEEVCKKVARFL